jgi:hypothetical protein
MLASMAAEKSVVEGAEDQDNADIRRQPLPESISEEHEIETDYDRDHCHEVKRERHLPVHFGTTSARDSPELSRFFPRSAIRLPE